MHLFVVGCVIRFLLGEIVEPLARVKILVTPRESTSADAQIDEFLLKHGAPLSVASTLERYGRALPHPGETLLQTPVAANSSDTVGQHQIENTRGAGAESATEIRLSNSADSAFQILQRDWVQLSPYGDFPHAQGLQRVTFDAARAMERAFNTLASRAARLFAGAPMFVGHPDVPQFANQFTDRRAYGWIMALEARPEGLFGKMKWSAAGLELLANGHYKFVSPYWEARPVAEENGRPVFEPTALISAGLTNEPNLPVWPLANTRHAPPPAKIQDAIADALGNGRLTPQQIVQMQHDLAEDWEVGIAKLRVAPIVMHTRAYTEKLGARKNEVARFQNRRSRIHERVHQQMNLGRTYDQAWDAVKQEHPALFA